MEDQTPIPEGSLPRAGQVYQNEHEIYLNVGRGGSYRLARFQDVQYKTVDTIAERNAIDEIFRTEGMLVWVNAESELYILVGGIENANWTPYLTGTYATVTGDNIDLDAFRTALNVNLTDNTSDADKPVSTAQATAIAVVQTDINNHEARTDNPHTVTKTQVGLSNVDNTTDLLKPISTATQTALDLKQSLSAKNQANGYAGLDSGALLPLSLFPDSVLGNLKYGGTYNGTVISASDDFPELNGQNLPTSGYVGVYFITTAQFTRASVTYDVGDWIIHNGSNNYVKVDNSDAVTTVFGRLGNVVANESDYSAYYLTLSTGGTVSGSITATSFTGAGTGLTGTASGLSIGGNAATATLASQWGITGASLTADFTTLQNTAPNYMLGAYSGVVKAASASALSAFLSGQTIGSVNTSTAYLPLTAGGGNPLSGALHTTTSTSNTVAGAINIQDGNGFWLMRTGADGSFNIDGFNSSPAYQNNLKITRDGAATLPGTLTLSSLTPGRVPYIGTAGLIQDDADLTFDGSNLSVGGNGVFGASLTMTGATPFMQWQNVGLSRLGYVQHDASNLIYNADVGGHLFNQAITAASTITSTQYKLSALNTAPSSAGDTGTLGEIRIDATHIYICTATNTWKRVAIATW